MISLEKQLTIHMAVMGAFESFKHHKEITSRCKKYLQEVLPEYTIATSTEKYHLSDKFEISIWGKDIPYDDKFYISFYVENNWQAKFLEEMDRLDPRDQIERRQQEAEIYSQFTALNKEVEKLLLKVQETKNSAQKLIEDLPVPKIAKARAESSYWERPSRDLEKEFPNLFK